MTRIRIAKRAQAIAERLRAGIRAGTYPGGSMLPSVRDLARLHGMGVNTVLAAFRLLEAEGLVCGTDFLLAYSPERIDPGNKRWSLRATPKVVAGVTEECRRRTETLYREVVEKGLPDQVFLTRKPLEPEVAGL